MTWPSADVVTANLDTDGDSPTNARQDLLDLVQKFNELRNHFTTFTQSFAALANVASAREFLGVPSSGSTVPLDRMRRIESNGGGSADVGASSVTVMTLTCNTVVRGDRIFVTSYAQFIKSGAGGRCMLYCGKDSGTAGIAVYGTSDNALRGAMTNANSGQSTVEIPCNGIIAVNSTGNLVLKIFAQSDVSTSNVSAIGQALVLIGS